MVSKVESHRVTTGLSTFPPISSERFLASWAKEAAKANTWKTLPRAMFPSAGRKDGKILQILFLHIDKPYFSYVSSNTFNDQSCSVE